MENAGTQDRLSQFLKTGIYRFENSAATFIDPVHVINRGYARFRVSPSSYYSRFFHDSHNKPIQKETEAVSDSRKRKRNKQKQPRPLNETEQIAQQRHQVRPDPLFCGIFVCPMSQVGILGLWAIFFLFFFSTPLGEFLIFLGKKIDGLKRARPLLLEALEALLKATELLGVLRSLRNDEYTEEECRDSLPKRESSELNFVQLGSVWQAPFCEISLHLDEDKDHIEDTGGGRTVVPVFNNLVVNEGDNDVEAEILGHRYIIPRKSCFYMSDLHEIRNLVPVESDCGFNLILIDPPWENSSAHQKLKYQTLPNRHFLSLPIKQLTHTAGALIALWVTNREKLQRFIENELFPAWGVKYAATVYWLKVKADGSLIGELDLFHHRPYECLLLGYSGLKDVDVDILPGHKPLPDNQVFISVPGDYSRKPPIGDMLLEYAPSYGHARGIELFARELTAGWCCWGNEPLHFQDTKYFVKMRGL